MGEKLRTLGMLHCPNGLLKVELNAPMVFGQPQIIHLHSKCFRYEMNENEFLQAAGVFLEGERQLRWLKGKQYE